jgi:hypothetical protein
LVQAQWLEGFNQRLRRRKITDVGKAVVLNGAKIRPVWDSFTQPIAAII